MVTDALILKPEDRRDRPVSLTLAGRVAVVTIDHPPVNALSGAVRSRLSVVLDEAFADGAAGAVLIRAAGRTWPAGADIRELGAGEEDGRHGDSPPLGDICARIATAPKPVIVHLHGTALGGGLEVALAAQVRLARRGTDLGLPEVKLGLLPGAGGTQRLPRLIGVEAALSLMLTGEPVGAQRALELGLIDALIAADPAAAEAEALAIAEGLAGTLPSGDRAPRDEAAAWLLAVSTARKALAAQTGARLPAPARIVDCVEAALLLPRDAGFVMERTAFGDLMAMPQSRALRHAFLAERRAPRHPRLAGVVPRTVARVAVAGGGAVGADLAAALLRTGLAVSFSAEDTAALAAGLARIAAAQELALGAGEITGDRREADWARLQGGLGLDGFATADLGMLVGARAAEAAHSAAHVLPEGAVLVIAEAPGDVASRAAASGRGGDVIGLALGPSGIEGPLVEVIAPLASDPSAVAAGVSLARRMGRVPVVTRAHLAVRVEAALARAAGGLLDLGVAPYDIDRAALAWGLPEGPLAERDRLGVAETAGEAASGPVAAALAEAMALLGRGGRAAGAGFYRYDEAGRAHEDADLMGLVAAAQAAAGVTARVMPGAEIAAHLLAGLANDGARLLAAEVIARPSDFDVAAMLGAGFPRWRGGPMQAADEAGLLGLRAILRRMAGAGDPFWQPVAIWDELIRNGQRFGDLNAD